MARPYRLKKSRRLFHKVNSLYKKGWKKLPPADLERTERDLEALDQTLLKRDREGASELAKGLEAYSPKLFKKHPVRWVIEMVVAIAIALTAAIVIRQMWFEPMEIPSGSMRPTYPHFFFNPDRVKRTGVFIFTSEDMDIPDQDTTYFGIPGKKRLIKRVMGSRATPSTSMGGKSMGWMPKGTIS